MRKIEKLPDNLWADSYQKYFTYTGYWFVGKNGIKIPIISYDGIQNFTFEFDSDKKKYIVTEIDITKSLFDKEITCINREIVGDKLYFNAKVLLKNSNTGEYKTLRKATFNQLFGKRKDNIEMYVVLRKNDGEHKGYYVCKSIIDVKQNKIDEFFFFETMGGEFEYVESQRQRIIREFK